MDRRKNRMYALGGFVLGVLLTATVWLFVDRQAGMGAIADPAEARTEAAAAPSVGESQAEAAETASSVEEPQAEVAAMPSVEEPQAEAAATPSVEAPQAEAAATTPSVAVTDEAGLAQETMEAEGGASATQEAAADIWDNAAVYTGGDTVSYQGRRYRARWWTQGENPGGSDVWEDLGILDGEPVQPEGVDDVPIDATAPQNTERTDFKVVGYYPSWKPDGLSSVDFGIVTHVCYAFAIPTAEGGLRDLENPDTALKLIRSAHENGARVLLSVGGWSYNDVPLETVFLEATADQAGVERLAAAILAMCEEYGFDGVDMDWEHPRVDGASSRQYEALMLALSEQLHARDKLLTAAVLGGVTADGNIYYDAAAHTNAVLNAVDFINVMAYDGGDGERHSPYQLAVDCGAYWKETRGLPAYKVVLGVPFYARPGWAGYGAILADVPDACEGDHTVYNGMEVYYNGMDTIAQKTRYARENLGGVMVWELKQDTGDRRKSLLQVIGDVLEAP